MKYDVTIIGAGITGSAIAFELSKYQIKTCVIEANNDVSMGTTKANSGIVHAGYDPKPNTKMARLNVLGSKMYQELAPLMNVHYKKIGSLVVGRKEERAFIEELYSRGILNGVDDMKIIEREELHKLEPNLADDLEVALLSNTAAIVSPWEMCLAFAENAVRNGVDLFLSNKVIGIKKQKEGFMIQTNQQEIETSYVINAAGVYADQIYQMALGEKQKGFTISPVKGEYYLLDKSQGSLVSHVIFQVPNEKGKGVLVSQTVHGNLIVGPNASRDVLSKEDYSTRAEALAYVKERSVLSVPTISFRENIRNFSGLRAVLDEEKDFLIEASKEVPGFINFAGIKSPGLSCAPAFGPEAKVLLEQAGLTFEAKKDFSIEPLPKYFVDMTKEELAQKIKENPLYGRIICRCETVSEGEIVDALHRPIVPTTIDAIKRRTNAGMGRCQGGFCGPKVLEIMMRELKLKATEIMQDRDESYIVLSHTKGGSDDE